MTRWLAAAQRAIGAGTKLTQPTKPLPDEVMSVLSVLSEDETPDGSPLPEAEEADALDAYEERAAVREYDGSEDRGAAEVAALAEVAKAAGMAPSALQRLWADHPDARAYMAHLMEHGPATVGAAASDLGWGATRAWQAAARLRAAGLARHDGLGRALLNESA